MGTSENNQNEPLLSQKDHETSMHAHNSTRNMTLPPLQPHSERENVLLEDNVSPSLKRKRMQSPPRRTPSTGLMDALLSKRTHSTGLMDALLSSHTAGRNPAGNYVAAVAASINRTPSTSIRHTPNQKNAFRSRAKIGPIRSGEHAPRDGPNHVPPIAFLSGSLSLVARKQASHSQAGSHSVVGAPARRTKKAAGSSADTSVPHASRVASTNAQAASTSYASPFRTTLPFPAASTKSTKPAVVSVTNNARTRAETGASAHEPAPRYAYNSLIRRPVVPSAPGGHYRNAVYHHEPAGQHDVEAACETEEAPLGVLEGPPALDWESVAAHVAALRDQSKTGAGKEAAAQWWVAPRANTAPSAAYAALLEETFGAGSVLRGEGAKPRRKAGVGPRRSLSSGTGRSASSTVDFDGMDVDMDDGTNVDTGAEGGSRASAWIAEIQAVVKGETTLVREDLKSLADTMREISNMETAEGRALGDDAPRLRKSIWQLAQKEDIPFRDEHKLRLWARKLLKHWPVN